MEYEGSARMTSEAAKVRRRIDEAGSSRSDGSQRPRKPTLMERLKRLVRRLRPNA
jgi:hypothetical protein